MSRRKTEVDLFGDPVPANWGGRGRPEHIPTRENRAKVAMMVALGWSSARIAGALRTTEPTLRKHYFSQLRFRDVARDRLDLRRAMLTWAQCEKGNVAALKEFDRLLERNDLMLYGQRRTEEPKPEKLGKKQQALRDAQAPAADTPLGELMARRQAEATEH